MRALFVRERFTHVVHLAAQPGVRRSLTHPYDYLRNNIEGFLTLLETVREYPVEHLVYASSSSVYGTNSKIPFSESDPVDRPESLYAASKRSDELMAHVYARLYGVPATGLRFFTVYGPCGRPDMAYFGFTDKLVKGQKIQIFNYGNCRRDFTYIDNVIEMNMRAMTTTNPDAVNQIYNTAFGERTTLNQLVIHLREFLGAKDPAIRDIEPTHGPNRAGDIPHSLACIDKARTLLGYDPKFSMRDGLKIAVDWYWENL